MIVLLTLISLAVLLCVLLTGIVHALKDCTGASGPRNEIPVLGRAVSVTATLATNASCSLDASAHKIKQAAPEFDLR